MRIAPLCAYQDRCSAHNPTVQSTPARPHTHTRPPAGRALRIDASVPPLRGGADRQGDSGGARHSGALLGAGPEEREVHRLRLLRREEVRDDAWIQQRERQRGPTMHCRQQDPRQRAQALGGQAARDDEAAWAARGAPCATRACHGTSLFSRLVLGWTPIFATNYY